MAVGMRLLFVAFVMALLTFVTLYMAQSASEASGAVSGSGRRTVPMKTNAGQFNGDYEFYSIDSRYTLLRDTKWLEEKPVDDWPTWLLTALVNYLYCKRHGYSMVLWTIPESRLSNFTNRGWGNVLSAQYVKARMDEGGYPKRDWVVYMDSDSYIRRQRLRVENMLANQDLRIPVEIYPGDVEVQLTDEGNPIKALKKSKAISNVTEEIFAVIAPEVPLPVFLEGIARDSYVNSGVIFFNMNHDKTNHLLTTWSRAVEDICGPEWRFYRLADQQCFNIIFFREPTKQRYLKYLAIPTNPVAFNSPAGDFIRHTWGVRENQFKIFGMDLLNQGYRTKKKLLELVHELIESGSVRQLPIVVGPNSPAYQVGGDDWDIQTEEMAKKASNVIRQGWKARHSRIPQGRSSSAVNASSSAECLVKGQALCDVVGWKVGEDMRGSCRCYTNSDAKAEQISLFSTTWKK